MSTLLSVQKLKKSFGGDVLFTDVSFQIENKEKAAIVGPNGCGKSTLLKMITGEEPYDDGVVVIEKERSIGFLKQYQETAHADDIYEYVLHAREDLLSMEARLHELEEQMGQGDVHDVMDEYHSLTHTFEAAGGRSFRSEVTGVLKGLGFPEEQHHVSMESLSGGQKTRVNLGRLLLSDPDLLLLDEPTNHLDLDAIRWLEGFLSNYKKTVLIVAHDRYFLDRVVSRVIDLSAHVSKSYKGNYTEYTRQKAQWLAAKQNEYEKNRAKIAHEEKVIEKLKQFNREKSIKRAESREKKLEKMERVEAPVTPKTKMRLSLAPDIESGKDVIFVEDLSKSFGEHRLFSGLSFSQRRGERVAVIGANGCGKTTLLKIINEVIPPDGGEIRLGTKVTIGYYDQEQQNLDEEKTLFEELSDYNPKMTETKIRNVLAAFLFREDDVFKQIKELSGGERGRISLCKLMLSGANYLILDEPTNHLDMESKEILANALLSFEGTLLYVSHDRYFINQTAQRILEMNDRGITEYLGDYDYYLKKKEELFGDEEKAAKQSEASNDSKQKWEEQKKEKARRKKLAERLKSVEEEIENLEEEQSGIEEQFLDEETAKNSAKLNELTERNNEITAKLETLYEEWEQLGSQE